MAVAYQTLLDNATTALNNLLLMDAVESYTAQERSFRAQRIAELYAVIEKLEQKLNLASGSARLVKPVQEVA
jgi:hypothetical protein